MMTRMRTTKTLRMTSKSLFNPSILPLYLICTAIWGSTWIVIKFQLETATPLVAVFYRFVLATVILLAFCFLTGRRLSWDLGHHRDFALQGSFNFSLNFILTYIAEQYTSSGLVALTFTTLIYMNMFGLWVFFNKPIQKNVIWGSVLGGLGIACVFYNEILNFEWGSASVMGLSIAMLATVFASIGNLLSTRILARGVPVASANTWGIFYGAVCTGVCALLMGTDLTPPTAPLFWGHLFYLAVFGTVIAFGAYISLVGRIGAEKAAYTGLVSPLLALALSSFFEGFQWTLAIVIGMALCLGGNILTLRKKGPALTSSQGSRRSV